MHLWRDLQGQSTSRMPLWSSMGKSGDLGDHLGDKIKALSVGTGIPTVCFLFGWLLMPLRFMFLLPLYTVHKQPWGILEPQVKSFVVFWSHPYYLSHPLRSSYSPINFPFPLLNSTVPSLRVTCSLSPAPSCVLRPFQLLGDLVPIVYCPPLSLLRP